MSFEMKVKMVKVKGIFEYNMKKSGCLEDNLKFEIMINSNYIEREKEMFFQIVRDHDILNYEYFLNTY